MAYTRTALTTATNIATAETHIGKGAMVSSAKLCLDDARALAEKGDYHNADMRAAQSVAYSVGKFHKDYAYIMGLPPVL